MISIIIATYNRAPLLRKVLDALLTQEGGGEVLHELIVVDNASTDATAMLAGAYDPLFSGRLVWLHEPHRGKGFALNTAAARAQGEWLAFLDDDVLPHRRWLSRLRAFLSASRPDAYGGRVLPLYPDDVPKWIVDNARLLSGPIVMHDYGEGTMPYEGKMLPFVGANCGVRRDVLLQCGSFRCDIGPGSGMMGEDTDLFWRIRASGRKVLYCGSILVHHPVPKNRMRWRYLARWYKAYGRYTVREREEARREDAVRLFGAPRYLYRRAATEGLRVLQTLGDKSLCVPHWMRLFMTLGQVEEYRRRVET